MGTKAIITLNGGTEWDRRDGTNCEHEPTQINCQKGSPFLGTFPKCVSRMYLSINGPPSTPNEFTKGHCQAL